MDDTYLVVLVTVPSREVGREVANKLVDKRLAACVNLVPGVVSIYRWQGKLEEDDELLLVIKTRASHFKRLAAEIKKMHPYDLPEVIGLPIVQGSQEYLTWLGGETA